jgi:acylphosphatase
VAARRIIFRGRVQGVGFRKRTKAVAARFRVTGYVKNLGDGTVELIAEGDDREIDEFLADISRAMAREIAESESEAIAPHGYPDFDIRRE